MTSLRLICHLYSCQCYMKTTFDHKHLGGRNCSNLLLLHMDRPFQIDFSACCLQICPFVISMPGICRQTADLSAANIPFTFLQKTVQQFASLLQIYIFAVDIPFTLIWTELLFWRRQKIYILGIFRQTVQQVAYLLYIHMDKPVTTGFSVVDRSFRFLIHIDKSSTKWHLCCMCTIYTWTDGRLLASLLQIGHSDSGYILTDH